MRLRIKATETAALKSGRQEEAGLSLKRKYQAGRRHRGMSVLVDLEAGHLEIRSLIDESAILCAQESICLAMRHIEPTAIKKAPRVCSLLTDPSTWIEEHSLRLPRARMGIRS